MRSAATSTFALLCVLPTASAFSTRQAVVSPRTSSTQIYLQHAADMEEYSSTSALRAAVVEDPPAAAEKSWTDDGFVFGLEGSGLERPKGKEAVTFVEGDSLETQPYQQVIVGATFAAHAYFAATSFQGMLEANGGNLSATAVQAALLTITSWVLADFGSGVFHWSVDNYGNGKTPVMGGIIAAFQGHHTAPWTITERGFCNNVYKLCAPFGILPMTVINTVTGPATTFFFTLFCIFEICSQEFHKWSHQLPRESPPVGNTMQKMGLTVGRKQHALHHTAPFEGNYCIISGLCNSALDGSGFFRRLEHAIYRWNGVEPNAWKLDPALRERTLAGDYSLPRAKAN
jgi:ubiquitin-conjugating enzyme E2 variant